MHCGTLWYPDGAETVITVMQQLLYEDYVDVGPMESMPIVVIIEGRYTEHVHGGLCWAGRTVENLAAWHAVRQIDGMDLLAPLPSSYLSRPISCVRGRISSGKTGHELRHY